MSTDTSLVLLPIDGGSQIMNEKIHVTEGLGTRLYIPLFTQTIKQYVMLYVLIPIEIKKLGPEAIEVYWEALMEGKEKIPYWSGTFCGIGFGSIDTESCAG